MRVIPVFTTEAEEELAAAYSWYEAQLPGLGEELIEQVHRTLDRITENPRLYRALHEETRRALTERFPYAVFYQVDQDEIIVLGVVHQARDPEHWLVRSRST